MTERNQRVLAEGLGFCEGPVLTAEGALLVSSITHGAVYSVGEGGAERIADLGGGANSVTLAPGGRLVVTQNGGRWAKNGPQWHAADQGGLQFIDPDGSTGWLSHDPIAPNDLCIGPDGLAYVTDPTRSARLHDGRLWRTDPASGATELLASVPYFCNGIAFGPGDELYVASTIPAAMYRYEVRADGTLSQGVRLFELPEGNPDGFTVDADGNLIIGAISYDERPGRIQTWSPDGELLDVYTPGTGKHYTNLLQLPDGALIVCDSDGGAVLCIDHWPARPLAAHPLR